MTDRYAIVGAGLVGSLLSLFLARAGKKTVVYEKRKDLRTSSNSQVEGGGRSINLALSARGIHALKLLGLEAEVIKHSIPMHGRILHALDGAITFQPYGIKAEHAIHSISRNWLNSFLVNKAEKEGVVFVFEKELCSVDFKNQSLFFTGQATPSLGMPYPFLFGADGSHSRVRALMEEQGYCQSVTSELSHGYKEFLLKAGPTGKFQMNSNGLHIWPRGNFMLIALPNLDRSFTCTLFLPHRSTPGSPAPSFENLNTPKSIETFLNRYFKDFIGFVPNCINQFQAHPTGRMATIKSLPWSSPEGRVLLLGDAAHGIVPFFGQGMNCGFEDCETLHRLGFTHDFHSFFNQRKVHTDAIADMAVENFTEMSEKTADPVFLFQKQIEREIQTRFPNRFVSKYSLVSFSHTPYALAKQAGEIQARLLNQLSQGKTSLEELDWEQVKQSIDSNEELSSLLQQILQEGPAL